MNIYSLSPHLQANTLVTAYLQIKCHGRLQAAQWNKAGIRISMRLYVWVCVCVGVFVRLR